MNIITVLSESHNITQTTHPGSHGYARCKLLNDRRRVVTEDTVGAFDVWDIVQCKLLSTRKAQQQPCEMTIEDMACSLENGSVWAAPWCEVDTNLGVCTGR